ncbi:MAG: 5-carboxymethyl-2-hydroxymuconate Delta-isomerase [Hyphomicrobiales bacterium]|nr:MAG: 5-carboxymethyl-2-hydroxymuconate Delta-isomerase [Hyphomicrobiales bacterium]
MPHINIEYSANLDSSVDFDALCRLVLKTALDTGIFEPGAVRVRAFRAEHYAVADDLPDNSFIDLSCRIGAGRSPADKQATGEAIFEAVAQHVNQLLATQHFALSLEIREIDPVLSWKRNSIHPRLRGK